MYTYLVLLELTLSLLSFMHKDPRSMLCFNVFFVILQKEIALYTASKFSYEFCSFDIDGDIAALFKVKLMKIILPFLGPFHSYQFNGVLLSTKKIKGVIIENPCLLDFRVCFC